MWRKTVWALAVLACLVIPVAVQAQGDYLDIYVAKVKPEKVSQFEALAKKMADANRASGDRWLTMVNLYGEGNKYVFVSPRHDYADVEKAEDVFYGALVKAFGKEGAEKMENEWNNCVASVHTELRKRRWDLSRKAPTGDDYAKYVGGSRFLRTTMVRVRPGRVADFEALLKDLKAAGEQNAETQPVFVSQVMEGGHGTVFYLSALRSSLGGFDKNPTTREILGEDGYKKFLQMSADTIDEAGSEVYRYSAEMSSPPPAVAAAAPDFWQPKAAATPAKAKAKPAPAAPKN